MGGASGRAAGAVSNQRLLAVAHFGEEKMADIVTSMTDDVGQQDVTFKLIVILVLVRVNTY